MKDQARHLLQEIMTGVTTDQVIARHPEKVIQAGAMTDRAIHHLREVNHLHPLVETIHHQAQEGAHPVAVQVVAHVHRARS